MDESRVDKDRIVPRPTLCFPIGGAKGTVTKEAQPWFAKTGKFFNFDLVNCLNRPNFRLIWTRNEAKFTNE